MTKASRSHAAAAAKARTASNRARPIARESSGRRAIAEGVAPRSERTDTECARDPLAQYVGIDSIGVFGCVQTRLEDGNLLQLLGVERDFFLQVVAHRMVTVGVIFCQRQEVLGGHSAGHERRIGRRRFSWIL